MALVDIVNENVHPYSCNFRGEKVVIPPGGKFAIDEEDAPAFLGQKPPLKYDGQDNQMAESYSMLQVKRRDHGTAIVDKEKFVCHMDGKVFYSKAELDDYIEQNYLEDMAEKEVADTLKKKAGRPKKEA